MGSSLQKKKREKNNSWYHSIYSVICLSLSLLLLPPVTAIDLHQHLSPAIPSAPSIDPSQHPQQQKKWNKYSIIQAFFFLYTPDLITFPVPESSQSLSNSSPLHCSVPTSWLIAILTVRLSWLSILHLSVMLYTILILHTVLHNSCLLSFYLFIHIQSRFLSSYSRPHTIYFFKYIVCFILSIRQHLPIFINNLYCIFYSLHSFVFCKTFSFS